METENVNVKNWKSLIKPTKLDVKMSEDLTQATIVAEPLEKGYGLTLGNSLRRILLSSIRGAAVTSIQIDGVLHEFTSIKGVREDVTDIVLNVKNLSEFFNKIDLEVKISNKDIFLIQAFDKERNYSESAVYTRKTGELIHEITTNIKQEEKEKDISFYSCKNSNKDT